MVESFNERKRVSTYLSTAQIATLKKQLSGSGCVVHEPGSKGYAQATRLWNSTVERKPALIASVSNTNDVRMALLGARAAGLPVSVRNGGQDWVGRALRDGGLVLDLTPMRQCSVNVETLEATISGGVTVADLNSAAGKTESVTAIIARTDPNEQESVVLLPELESIHPPNEPLN